jgi:hypothetical protein
LKLFSLQRRPGLTTSKPNCENLGLADGRRLSIFTLFGSSDVLAK